jgi:hypothetical protein
MPPCRSSIVPSSYTITRAARHHCVRGLGIRRPAILKSHVDPEGGAIYPSGSGRQMRAGTIHPGKSAVRDGREDRAKGRESGAYGERRELLIQAPR